MPDPAGDDRNRGPRDRSLRAADSDREAFAAILRDEHLAGRLDSDEFQERIERCVAAKTYADLDLLVADLPGRRDERRRNGPPWRARPWPLALVPLVLVAAIVVGAGHHFWFVIPLLAFFVIRPLIWRSWGWGFWGCGPRVR